MEHLHHDNNAKESNETPPKASAKATEISKRLSLPPNHNPINASPEKASAEFTNLWDAAKDAARVCRELPNFGGTDMWRWPFSRACETWERLWQYQRDNRAALQDPTGYGLEPWHIGYIASKIGQIFFQYYIRTSDANYLSKALRWYRHPKKYFSEYLQDTTESTFCLQYIRVLIRATSVSLLADEPWQNTDEILKELREVITSRSISTQVIQDYLRIGQEAQLLLDSCRRQQTCDAASKHSVRKFLAARMPRDVFLREYVKYHKGQPKKKFIPETSTAHLRKLSGNGHWVAIKHGDSHLEVLLVGGRTGVPKYSHICLNMLRMLQVVELERNWEQHKSKSGATNERVLHKANPQKCLLFRPSAEDVIVHISAAMSDLARGTTSAACTDAMLVYLSTHGHRKSACSAWLGCQLQPNKNQPRHDDGNSPSNPNDVLSVHDLYSATRHALLVVIDCPGARHFECLEPKFGQPLLVLMAPSRCAPAIDHNAHETRMHSQEQNAGIHHTNTPSNTSPCMPSADMATTDVDPRMSSTILAHFLTAPLDALLSLCAVDYASGTVSAPLAAKVAQILEDISTTYTESPDLDSSYRVFVTDVFLARIIVRFTFFACVCLEYEEHNLSHIHSYKDTCGDSVQPSARPALPPWVYDSTSLVRRSVNSLAAELDILRGSTSGKEEACIPPDAVSKRRKTEEGPSACS
eukprot:m.242300 g.242300  ORF g.242300 m.242300 type:complete len:696 (-) comp19441_c0_seq2:264-2351(-)